jgi:hypothetical protein
MRKSLWIVGLVFAVIAAPNTRADVTENYTITFTGGPPIPTSGTFTYDSTTPSFSNFQVIFDGRDFDFTSTANNPLDNINPQINTGGPSCIGGTTGPQAVFDLLTACTSIAYWDSVSLSFSNPEEVAFGFDASDSNGNIGMTGYYYNGDPSASFNQPYVSGGFTTAAVTPEPGTAILWFTGIVLMIVGRKRIAHLLRPEPGTHGSLSPH